MPFPIVAELSRNIELKSDLSLLLQKDESPILEFKREWYWGDSPNPDGMSDKWGELIKDLISLANGYLEHVGHHRYLIFGYAENESKIYPVDCKSIKHLSDLKGFKKKLLQKLEKHTKPSLLGIEIEEVSMEEGCLLIFEIACPITLTELKQGLKTKTRHLDEGAILVRKGQKTDEIRTATPDEIISLKGEFEAFKDSKLFERMNSEPLDVKPKQERTIEKTIQSYIDKNASYSLADDYPKKVKNWKEGIIYEAYKLVDSLGGNREFVYIHDSANQGKTLADIKKTKAITQINSVVVLIDRPKIKDVSKRKLNIEKLFKSSHVYFIDEFGYKFLYKDCILPFEKFNLPVYVDGLYDEDTIKDCSALHRLESWFESENEPLFIVSGHGGIGKTTLAKQFLDHVYDVSDEPGILFIDSKEIIHELSRKFSHTNKINDVYDFYTALMDSGASEISKFDKELLKLSIDNGSLIVVLDGIDEVIAKLGEKFDVESFITSIFEEYSSDLNKTKILITCRDHFWNDIGKKISLPEITLKAFNEKLANDFFTQKLNGEQKKISKALSMAQELAIEENLDNKSSGAQTYIPFLLDMIGYLVKTQSDNINSSELFESRYLNNNDHTDILVGQICKREIIKLESLSLDNQIQLFMRMALQKEGRISMYDIKNELSDITSDVDETLIEKIKGHPLIQFTDNHLYFRYDVFETYFKSLLVVDLFKNQKVESLDSNCAEIISGYLKYDSSFSKAITSKVELNDDLLLFCIELIELSKEMEDLKYESFVSAVVCFLLNLSKKDQTKPYDLSSRTALIETLFWNDSEIKGLCLVDIFGSMNSKPTFDFKGKTLSNCHFHNYEYFWECSIDENTRFKKSSFKDIEPREGIKFEIPKNLFSKSCDTTLIDHLLTKKTEEIENTTSIVKAHLLKVFKLFHERNNFYPRKQEEVRKKLTTVTLLPTLISKGVIINFKDPKKPTMKQYKVHNNYKSVIEYFEQGTPSAELDTLIQEFI